MTTDRGYAGKTTSQLSREARERAAAAAKVRESREMQERRRFAARLGGFQPEPLEAEPAPQRPGTVYKLSIDIETGSLYVAGKVEEAIKAALGERDLLSIQVRTVKR